MGLQHKANRTFLSEWSCGSSYEVLGCHGRSFKAHFVLMHLKVFMCRRLCGVVLTQLHNVMSCNSHNITIVLRILSFYCQIKNTPDAAVVAFGICLSVLTLAPTNCSTYCM